MDEEEVQGTRRKAEVEDIARRIAEDTEKQRSKREAAEAERQRKLAERAALYGRKEEEEPAGSRW